MSNPLILVKQHLDDPIHAPVPVFIGRDKIGKTNLLRHIALPQTHSIYIALQHYPTEKAWMRAFIEATQAYFYEQPLGIPDESTMKTWFANEELPNLLGRRDYILFLLDDIQHLLSIPHAFEYLQSLLQQRVGLVLAIHQDFEDQLDKLKPLSVTSLRLTLLGREAVRTSFNHLPESDIDYIYAETGGEPYLVELYRSNLQNTDNIKAITPIVYRESDSFFRNRWKRLNRDERLVLTAVSSLIYDDPLQKIDTATIESWLVDTDFPMDDTSINATFRSLEYAELLGGSATNIQTRSDILQRWLLENARLPHAQSQMMSDIMPNKASWLIIAVLILVGILGLAILSSSATHESNNTPVPTIQLGD